ncbi:uncharacterized protein AKAW2_51366S [Aspergillus luchuensis]|uniref:Uncharacterized protein n=1 Tax=Aspergillus kawachii TaxID=1069201 RepID=A0A7R7WDZ4_ASPKA|nr:uncharacterized protein AKAW2_51366S [Aspergillus luchuensis]BCS01025.1 hypothetical protein AKAW2_51366S [Aspergillus luchuensis]
MQYRVYECAADDSSFSLAFGPTSMDTKVRMKTQSILRGPLRWQYDDDEPVSPMICLLCCLRATKGDSYSPQTQFLKTLLSHQEGPIRLRLSRSPNMPIKTPCVKEESTLR